MTYYKKFIDFLKKHNLYDEESFSFINNCTRNIDYEKIQEREFIGCYYRTNENGELINFKLYVPRMINEKTVLINIHEYVHALILYNSLNKICDIGLEREVLPILYEKLYVLENNNLSLEEYENSMTKIIEEINKEQYKIGISIANELISSKECDIQDLNEKAKILVKNYRSI